MKTFVYRMDGGYGEFVGVVVADNEQAAEELMRLRWRTHDEAKHVDAPVLVKELKPGEVFIGGHVE